MGKIQCLFVIMFCPLPICSPAVCMAFKTFIVESGYDQSGSSRLWPALSCSFVTKTHGHNYSYIARLEIVCLKLPLTPDLH